jgi:predicted acyl esterase
VEWTGALEAKLFVRVGKGSPDAEFVARVSDVYPDGRSILIADYTRLVSLRAGLNAPPQPPSHQTDAEPCVLNFRIGWLSQNFNAGHRIRITVACTGGPLHETFNVSHGIRATHQLCCGAGQASHVLAPMMPRERGVGEGPGGVTGRQGEDGKQQGRAYREELSKGIFPT